MFDTVNCPYCDHENDMSDALSDGLSSDNTLDWECRECEKEFEVQVEFMPTYSASKIVYLICEMCGTKTRDAVHKGLIFPWPEKVSETCLCRSCFHKAVVKEMNAG